MKYYVKSKTRYSEGDYSIEYFLYKKRLLWFDKLIYASYNNERIKSILEEILYIENMVNNIQQEDYLKNNP